MNNPLISVIVPVYNVEMYIRKCVDSLLSQNYTNIEIILVDDGSPDKCPEICDEYAKKDNRIKVIHKPNGGLSDARNAGTNIASGEYVIYVDSDDYWEGKDCLKGIVKKIEDKNPDLILFGCKDYNLLNEKIKVSRQGYDDNFMENSIKEDVLQYLFDNNLFPGAAWLTVTKRELIIKNNIYFIKGIKGEDYDWLFNVFLHAETFSAVNDTFYIYLKNRGTSITGTADIKSIEGIIITVKKWVEIIKPLQNEKIRRCYFAYLAKVLATTIITLDRIAPQDKNRGEELIKEYLFLFKYNKSKKIKLLSLSVKVFGLRFTAKLIKGLYNLRKKVV